MEKQRRNKTLCLPFCFTLFSCRVFLLTSVLVSNFKTSALDLNGARAAGKRARLFEAVKVKSVHVTFVQETRSDSTSDADWKKGWDGEVIVSHSGKNSGGGALLCSKDFLPQSHAVEEAVQGGLLAVKAK